jgi:hypothetical protein
MKMMKKMMMVIFNLLYNQPIPGLLMLQENQVIL